jgi:hypothetical protein
VVAPGLARQGGALGRVLARARADLAALSAVLRGELESEPVYLKAVFTVFHHEPAVTQTLAREHPDLVPDVLRIDAERGWLLMRELTGIPGSAARSSSTGRTPASLTRRSTGIASTSILSSRRRTRTRSRLRSNACTRP